MATAKVVQAGKRQRKPNYSAQENLFLAKCYEEFKDIIDTPHRDANINAKKKKAWDNICSQHKTRFPHIERSKDDLKLKLSKLKMESREKLLEKKNSRNKTGGGKPTTEPNPAQQKILDLCEETPGFKGLKSVETPATVSASQDQLPSDAGSDNDGDQSNETAEPAEEVTASATTSRTGTPSSSTIPRKYASFDDLVHIEKKNNFSNEKNLKLKRKKLKLQIQLLQQKVNEVNSPKDDGQVFFHL
ncbi:uncharacterized protein LOC135484274 [Lineus longissimus]|uniref:uncharacterized protein LOC135484274 n=1 Tax=Lineus longissimus TaxID=88925 RepID=UPI002B4D7112